jgi:hypothetical protein
LVKVIHKFKNHSGEKIDEKPKKILHDNTVIKIQTHKEENIFLKKDNKKTAGSPAECFVPLYKGDDKPQEEEIKPLQTEPELKLNKNIEPKKRTRKPPAELPSEEELVGRDMLKELMKVINKYKTIELSDVLIEDNNGDYKHWEIYETLEKQINEPAEIETIDNKPKRKRNPPKPKIKEVVDINKHVQVLTPEKIEKQEKHNKIIKTQPIPYKSTDRTTVAKKGKLSSKDVFSLMMNTF